MNNIVHDLQNDKTTISFLENIQEADESDNSNSPRKINENN